MQLHQIEDPISLKGLSTSRTTAVLGSEVENGYTVWGQSRFTCKNDTTLTNISLCDMY